MREGNALRMMSTTGSVVADDAHGSILPVRLSPSLRSVAPASAFSVGRLPWTHSRGFLRIEPLALLIEGAPVRNSDTVSCS
jgi:hypothetical protein